MHEIQEKEVTTQVHFSCYSGAMTLSKNLILFKASSWCTSDPVQSDDASHSDL